MILRLLALALAVAAPVPAANAAGANAVTMRGGEHPTFTRLVLAFPAGTEWQLGRGELGYALRLDVPGLTYDSTGLYDRIPSDRLAAVRPGDNGVLYLDLGCECHASAFLFQPDRLVIDIAEGPPKTPAFETELETVQPTAAPRFSLPLVSPEPVPPAAALRLEDPRTVGIGDPFQAALDRQTQHSGIELQLIESLARAASQGLLEPAAAAANARSAAAETGAEHTPMLDDHTVSQATNSHGSLESNLPHQTVQSAVPAALAPTATPTTSPTAIGPGMTAQTSIDRDRPVAQLRTLQTPSGTTCLSDEYLNLEAWGDDRDYSEQLAERRGALSAEFDQIPDGAVETLARTYLYFGFGAEARQALAMDGVRSHERTILTDIAAVVDGDPTPQSVFDDQLQCDGAVAFWALIAMGSRANGQEVDANRIQYTFRLLPDALRGHLGNRLAGIFVARGDANTAAMLLASAAPAISGNTVEGSIARADVAVLEGSPDEAIGELGDLARDDARLTPEGVIRLLQLSVQEGHDVDETLLTLAAGLRFQNRGLPVEAELAAAEVAALAALDRFGAAFALVTREADALGPARAVALNSQILLGLTERAGDVAFLNQALGELPPVANGAAQNAVAARLLRLGFADRAADLLLAPTDADNAGERRYLRAEAALATDRAEDVAEILIGMTGQRAARLRAEALAALGDFGAALEAGQAAPGTMPEASEEWRAGAWGRLAGSDDPLLKSAATAMLDRANLPATEPATANLASAEAALAAATQTHSMIDDLMERFSLDPETGQTTGQ